MSYCTLYSELSGCRSVVSAACVPVGLWERVFLCFPHSIHSLHSMETQKTCVLLHITVAVGLGPSLCGQKVLRLDDHKSTNWPEPFQPNSCSITGEIDTQPLDFIPAVWECYCGNNELQFTFHQIQVSHVEAPVMFKFSSRNLKWMQSRLQTYMYNYFLH